uniref:NADH-ubiquinone oxidoreductase chain 4 n=1 Tax=Protostrongylus rufescens TaxID=321386 RepID=A0A059SGA5_PRORF|nr:NADH dehydrogenase subunit 4 [Protostrongylus rufescens]AGW80394.1 NADH dehydrogenase subunit 4 [Protostrongylus rufescens]
MLVLLFFSFLTFYFPYMFFFFMMLVSFFMVNDISWAGIFYFCDSYVFVLLIIMMLFILGLVVFSEQDSNLKMLSLLLIVFCFFFLLSSNMLMLYMFFELSMFPILVMILGFGSQIEKISSSYYLLFYTTFCSLPFLFVYFKSFFYISYCYFDFYLSWEFFFILSMSFMVKFPVYFLHLWLPKAHVEAPTTASMLLAGLLLKLGTAGFLRILGSFNFVFNNFWIFLSLVSMIISSFCCLLQSDSKSLAAYSSINHMGFLLLSISIFLLSGKTSALMLMLAHGYTSTLMFFLIGEYYHSSSTRMMYFFNGFFCSSLIFTIMIFLVFLSNSGIPPSLSFLSEFILIASIFLLSKSFFFMIFIYFLVSFYYSVFLIVCSSMKSKVLSFSLNLMGYSVFLVLMMFNIFWWSLFY